MRNTSINYGGSYIFLSYLCALILSVMPMADEWIAYRPQWLCLVLIYWSIYLSHRVGLMSAWLLGFMLDVLYGNFLGHYALSMSIMVFICIQFRTRLINLPMQQQLFIVLMLILLFQLLNLWIGSMILAKVVYFEKSYWFSSLLSALLWPFIVHLLTKLQYRFGIQ